MNKKVKPSVLQSIATTLGHLLMNYIIGEVKTTQTVIMHFVHLTNACLKLSRDQMLAKWFRRMVKQVALDKEAFENLKKENGKQLRDLAMVGVRLVLGVLFAQQMLAGVGLAARLIGAAGALAIIKLKADEVAEELDIKPKLAT